ncbi:MAG: phosphodiester glycosidase family protein [Gaiellaceae bacterium]
MIRPPIVATLVVLASLWASAPATAQAKQLLPGVTYEQDTQFSPHGPVAIHVVRGPRPTGLYRLRPALARETVTQRETVTSMQRRRSPQATAVGLNGDFFSLADGRPSGLTLRDGVLVTPPNPGRSSLGVGLDGLLDIRRVTLRATWVGTGPRRAVTVLNKAPGANGAALFTADWGRATPKLAGSFAVVLGSFPDLTPNADLEAVVTRVVDGGESVAIPAGTAVLVARGTAAARLREEAPVGAPVTVRLLLQPDWSAVSDAIGGGPVLVQDGRPVLQAGEAFTTSQLVPRNPRSAVGQRADGRILLVTTDGRQPGYSVGMTNFELAQAMARLGAVRAMALDSGGSATLAFDGVVLNRPSDGRERAVASALMLEYLGVHVPPPLEPVVSPNGDGVADRQRLSYKVVSPSEVSVTLTAPDGSAALSESGTRLPGTYRVPFPPPPPPSPEGLPPTSPSREGPPAEGRWSLRVSATDDQGLASSGVERFRVNSTLGFLRVQPSTLRLPPSGATTTIDWVQARPARVRVTVETREGDVLRSLSLGRLEPGQQAASWNGRLARGKVAPPGGYVVRVTASNQLGAVALERPVVVRRVAGPKK